MGPDMPGGWLSTPTSSMRGMPQCAAATEGLIEGTPNSPNKERVSHGLSPTPQILMGVLVDQCTINFYYVPTLKRVTSILGLARGSISL
jgi:hypothetical protein